MQVDMVIWNMIIVCSARNTPGILSKISIWMGAVDIISVKWSVITVKYMHEIILPTLALMLKWLGISNQTFWLASYPLISPFGQILWKEFFLTTCNKKAHSKHACVICCDPAQSLHISSRILSIFFCSSTNSSSSIISFSPSVLAVPALFVASCFPGILTSSLFVPKNGIPKFLNFPFISLTIWVWAL